MSNNELYHYGVLGMKWGRRRAKAYETRANRLKSKIDSKKSKGKMLRGTDRNKILAEANLRSRAADLKKNEKVSARVRSKNAKAAQIKALQEGKQYNRNLRAEKKAAKTRNMSEDAREMNKLKKKKVNELTNAELRKLNERQNLERTYKQNNKTKLAVGLAATGTALALLNKVGSIEDSIGKIERLSKRGQKIVNAIAKK